MMNNYLLVKTLRDARLAIDNYICYVCNKKGNDKNMGIEPNKNLKNGATLTIGNTHGAHLKCMEEQFTN